MRNKYFVFISALFIAACAREVVEPDNTGFKTFDCFTATVEESELTKAHLENFSSVKWDVGDSIGVFSDTQGPVPFYRGADGKFRGDKITGTKFYAYYPYEEGVYDSTSPMVLKMSSGFVLPMVAKTSDNNLVFKQTGSLLHFSITGSVTLNSVTLKGNSGEKINGSFRVNMEDDVPVLSSSEGIAESMVFTPASPVQLSSTENYEVCFVLPPISFESGFSLTVNYDEDASITKKTTKSISISRASVRKYSLVNLDELIEEETSWMEDAVPPDDEIWYTTTSGRVIQPTNNDFGASMVSNTYSDGKGIMKFDGPVIRVPDNAFENFMGSESTNLSGIYLPETVTRIGDAAFYMTKKLGFIQIPDAVNYIGNQAFMYTGLEELRLPENVEFGGTISLCNPNLKAIYSKYATDDHRCLIKDGILISFAPADLTEYTVPDGVIEIGDYCFEECRQLSILRLPGTVRTIGLSAIEDTGIADMVVPEGVETIRKWAFRQNANLRTITLPSSLLSIGSNVVGSCDNLEEFCGKYASSDGKCLVVDGELVSFARKGVTAFTTPPEVAVIGADVFWGDDELTDVTISEGVKEIRRGAFYGCDGIRSVYFPSTLEELGSRVISSSSLESIRGPFASEDGKCFIFKGKLIAVATRGMKSYSVPAGVSEVGAEAFLCAYDLKEITFPEGVTVIDENAVRICPSLKTVNLPASLKSIGNPDDSQNELFYSCKSLRRIFSPASMPPELTCSLMTDATIYVPNSSLDLYSGSPWGNFTVVGLDSFEKPDIYQSSDYSEDGKIVALQKASRGAGIDIYLMGDAFSDRQIADGTYDNVMKKACNALFSEEPYKTYRDCFNIWYVTVVSENEEISAFSNTALGAYFGKGTFIGGDTNAIWRYTSWRLTGDALAIVIVNDDRYAGTCHMNYDYTGRDFGCGDAIAYVPLNSSDEEFRLILLHEAGGHGFAKLDDEYGNGTTITETEIVEKYENPYARGWYKNVDITNEPTKIKWSKFLEDARYGGERIGIYEGGGTFTYGVWRPTENSIMNNNTDGFNAPSRYAIWYRINKLAYGENWNGNYEDFVTFDQEHRNEASTSQNSARTKSLVERRFEPLAPPVVVNKDWREVVGQNRSLYDD